MVITAFDCKVFLEDWSQAVLNNVKKRNKLNNEIPSHVLSCLFWCYYNRHKPTNKPKKDIRNSTQAI